MKLRIFFFGVLSAISLLLFAGCDLNPFAKPPAPAAKTETQNVATNETAGVIKNSTDALNDIEPDQVKLPDENGTAEALIPGAKVEDLAAGSTEQSSTEQTVTFDPNDSTTAKLAKCLTQKGVRMYGAFWCPHCQDQKAMFGDDFKFVKYFECDERGPDNQAPRCLADKIESYPTWFFPATGYDPGVKELEKIASLSGCERAME